ncbi:MAG: NAD(P)H-dependent oxidoreductase subunit E, partial [Thermodesulfovibrionia bacterium]|nr:NAD(P)H-dependent oxidoreductase subunit E [Thermodesulfovibrionia bacterium]
MFKKSVLRELEDIKGRYPEYKSAVLPALYIAQREFGWLSNEAILSVAKSLSIPEALVRGTASFYSMFKQRQAGRHLIQMC